MPTALVEPSLSGLGMDVRGRGQVHERQARLLHRLAQPVVTRHSRPRPRLAERPAHVPPRQGRWTSGPGGIVAVAQRRWPAPRPRAVVSWWTRAPGGAVEAFRCIAWAEASWMRAVVNRQLLSADVRGCPLTRVDAVRGGTRRTPRRGRLFHAGQPPALWRAPRWLATNSTGPPDRM
jgi:hypothetical protein